jgi:2-oxoglutarate ferredoxin oxidoreductase subunit gamma
VKIDSVIKVLQSRIPPGFLDMNKQALELGLQLAEPFKK